MFYNRYSIKFITIDRSCRKIATKFRLHRIVSGFHGAFATGVASQKGTLTLLDTWFRPPFWDLLVLQLLRQDSSNLPCLYSTFHHEYPFVLSRFCFRQRINKIVLKVSFRRSMVHMLSFISKLEKEPMEVRSEYCETCLMWPFKGREK